MKIHEQLNPEQLKAQQTMRQLLANQAEADRLYDALPGTHGGRIISTDLARFLDARYRDIPDGKPRDLAPSWDLAWRYAQARLTRRLSRGGRGEIVRFMAGGWGAGKTHALERTDAPLGVLAWDGTLKDTTWAESMIDLALRRNWRVEVAYVFRDIELALYGAVERAKAEGRSVPLPELAGNHRSVQLSIRRLLSRYRSNEHVSFLLLHNTGAKGVEGSALVIAEDELAPNGALHYVQRHADDYAQVARQVEALNSLEG
jgi:hypothetical protein